jgi:hypothetical protein
LTAVVRGFAATGDPRYRDVFRREVGVERNRDRAVEKGTACGREMPLLLTNEKVVSVGD